MPANATRPQWRDTLRCKAFPRVHMFKPDIVFVSAGFDAHEKEDLSKGFGKLIEFDFAWITREIQKLANLHCDGRVISVLEGGYNTRGGVLSPLAQSVCFHLEELRSRSKQKYHELTPEEYERLVEEDRENEARRIRGNEATGQERVQRMKRVKCEIGPNKAEFVELHTPAEESAEESEDLPSAELDSALAKIDPSYRPDDPVAEFEAKVDAQPLVDDHSHNQAKGTEEETDQNKVWKR